MTFILFPEDALKFADQLGGKAGALAVLAPHDFPIPAWFVLTPAAFVEATQWVSTVTGHAETNSPTTLLGQHLSSIARNSTTDDLNGSPQSVAVQPPVGAKHSASRLSRSADTNYPSVGAKHSASTLSRSADTNYPLVGAKHSASTLSRSADTDRPNALPLQPVPLLSPTVQTALKNALAQLCPHGELVAVRSSALEEDGVSHSFAGQLESFLNVPLEEVGDRIQQVWQSGFSDRLLTYRQEHQLEGLPQPPAVLIQQMVAADVAGVAFSANPVTGQRGVSVVSAVAGLGTSLVAGDADADTWTVNRGGAIGDRQLITPDRPLLTDKQIIAVAQLARRAERHFGRPQDIEWAIAQGTLYLLQSRPITTLSQTPDPDGVLNIWDNSNIAESYGGITTPLTFSFARHVYEQVYRQFCRMMGVADGAIAQHDTTFRRMLGLVRGRMYYNLLNWYRILALLPGFTINRHFMEQMMGVREELPADVLATLNQATRGDKIRDSLRLGRTLLGLVQNYATLPRHIRQFYQRLDRALQLPVAELATMRPDELVAHYHDLEQQLLTRWDAPLVNDFFAMIFYGVLRKLTVNWCGDTAGTLQNDLISGEGGMISAEPAIRVQQMAEAIDDPTFIALLCTGSLPQIMARMDSETDFKAQYDDYLTKFGDRCLEELKLESATLDDEPLMLLRAVGNVGSRLMGAPARGHSAAEDRQDVRYLAEMQVQTVLKPNPIKRILFNWVLQNARARVRDRENLRFERTRVFGRVRRIMVELGRRFYAHDLLTHPRDIFYLELPEILGTLDGTATSTNLKGLAALRQTEFEQYRHLPTPGDRLQTHGIATLGTLDVSSNMTDAKSSNQLATAPQSAFSIVNPAWIGLGCCPGIVRAPVQVITNPKTAVLQPGTILVAERTDPGWILLFPAAAGLLVERGSLLSHAAIVAREMRIPAIVSISGITQQLNDGDWVEMDGSTGTIRLIDPEIPFVESSTGAIE